MPSMTERRSQDSLQEPVEDIANVFCAFVIAKMRTYGKLDISTGWDHLKKRYSAYSKGIQSLEEAYAAFHNVVEDCQIPEFQVRRHGKILIVPIEWQRANCISAVSGNFEGVDPLTRDFLSILLIAKGVEKRLSLGAAKYPGSQWREYSQLADEVKAECGIDGKDVKLENVNLKNVLEALLNRSVQTQVVA